MGTMKLMPGIDEMHLENAEAQDGSTARTLKEFIEYARKNAPAENEIIIINGHGGSWSSFAPAKYNENSDMNIIEVAQAMKGQKAKLIYVHSCKMADIETFSELSQVADYVLASQLNEKYLSTKFLNKTRVDISHPFSVLSELTLNSDIADIKVIAKHACNFTDTDKWYLSKTDTIFLEDWKISNNFVLVNSQYIDKLHESLNEFADKIINSDSKDAYIKNIKTDIIKNLDPIIGSKYVYDLQRFLELIGNDISFSDDIKYVATRAKYALNSAIKKHYGTTRKKNHHGVSAQLPFSIGSSGYELRNSLNLSKKAPEWQKLCEAIATTE